MIDFIGFSLVKKKIAST